jgi:hypothetical protein
MNRKKLLIVPKVYNDESAFSLSIFELKDICIKQLVFKVNNSSFD